MASTTFVDKVTVIPTDWLNEVNGVVWTLFGGNSTASAGRTSLGLGTIATQNANSVSITGGTLSGTTITSPTINGGTMSSGTFTTGSITGTTLSTSSYIRPSLQAPNETTNGVSGSGTVTVDVNTAAYYTVTMTGNITTLTISNVPSSPALFSLTLEIIQGGSGSYTITWPGTVKWPGGVAPTLTTTVGKADVITLITRDGAASWLGFVAGQNL